MDGSETGTQDTQNLDSILNEYDSKQPTQPVEIKDPRLDKALEFIDQQQAADEQKRIDAAIDKISDGTKIDRDLAHAFLIAQANKDKSIDEAFSKSTSDPQAWEAILGRLNGELKEKFSIDQQATSDTEEMVSAVTGSKHSQEQPDEAPNFSKLNDREFFETISKEYGI